MYQKFNSLNFAEALPQFQYFVQTIQDPWTWVAISKLLTFSVFQYCKIWAKILIVKIFLAFNTKHQIQATIICFNTIIIYIFYVGGLYPPASFSMFHSVILGPIQHPKLHPLGKILVTGLFLTIQNALIDTQNYQLNIYRSGGEFNFSSFFKKNEKI